MGLCTMRVQVPRKIDCGRQFCGVLVWELFVLFVQLVVDFLENMWYNKEKKEREKFMEKFIPTTHLIEDRMDRVVFIATKIGFGEIVEEFFYRHKVF